MPQLIVRNIEEKVVRRLRALAAQDGVSAEEEHRRVLRKALLTTPPGGKLSFIEFLKTMPNVGDDALFTRPPSKHRKVDL